MPDDAEPGVVIVGVTGPLMNVQAPVPIEAVFAAIVAVPLVAQIVCGLPAFAVVGGALTMIETFDVEAVQGALLIVQRRLYVPAPPAGVNVAVGLLKLLNCDANVDGPLVTPQAPVPVPGVFSRGGAARPRPE